jgi:hypothetical protein
MITKICRVCGEEKPLSEYYKKASNRDGHSGICKPCKLAYDREHKGDDDYIEPDNSPPPMPPEMRLALDILIHAIRESRYRNNRQTRSWLLGQECKFYCESLGIRTEIIHRFVKLGCLPPSEMRKQREQLFEGLE